MPETHKTASETELSSQALTNIERLREAGEVGGYFADLYEEILQHVPALADIAIIPSSKEIDPDLTGTGGFILPALQPHNRSVVDELHMNTGDGWDHYARLITERPESTALNAARLGMRPEEMTPEDLAGFIFGHESGHCKWFSEHPSLDWPTWDKMRLSDLYSLPAFLPGVSLDDETNLLPNKIAAFMSTNSGVRYFAENEAEFSKKGLLTPLDVAAAQDAAYHNLPFEVYADDFAVETLQAHKNKLSQMGSIA
jgi:hypothetical protein